MKISILQYLNKLMVGQLFRNYYPLNRMMLLNLHHYLTKNSINEYLKQKY